MPEWWQELEPWQRSVALVAAAVLFFFIFRLVLLRKLERVARLTSNDLDDRLVLFIRRILGFVLFFVVLLGILKIYDIEITPLLASAGILGIALGLAAKETLSDLLSGMALIADQPMRVGDRVKIENIGRHWGAWGDVVDIGLRRTKIKNTDGVIVNYPNGLLSNSIITNFSFDQNPVRVRVRFQVDYEADMEKAKAVALEAIKMTPGVLPETVEIVIRSLWDDSQGHLLSGVLFEGRYRIGEIRKRTKIRSVILENILAAFKAEGIPLAIPRIALAGNTAEG